jgi:hypothetical protein
MASTILNGFLLDFFAVTFSCCFQCVKAVNHPYPIVWMDVAIPIAVKSDRKKGGIWLPIFGC